MVSAMAGTRWPRSESRTAKQRSDRLELRMRRACSRIKRWSGGSSIRVIRSLQTIAGGLDQMEEVSLPNLKHSYNPFRTGAYQGLCRYRVEQAAARGLTVQTRPIVHFKTLYDE